MDPTVVVLTFALVQARATEATVQKPKSAASSEQAAQPAPQPGDLAPQAPATGAAAIAPAVADTLRVQVMLDRSGFSPGAIDGNAGKNTRQALDLYSKQGGDPNAAIDPLTQYTITPEDAAGPFATDIPSDLTEQSKLPALAYRTVVEALAERFHTTPALLQKVNSGGATFEAGSVVMVPNVEPLVLPAPPPLRRHSSGDDGGGTAANGHETGGATAIPRRCLRNRTLSSASASRSRPSAWPTRRAMSCSTRPSRPAARTTRCRSASGRSTACRYNPTFHYNPELFWDADPSHSKSAIRPGPNNPVGVVWIDISKEHYGLHGTPEPSMIGHVESHGCVRLTNWDAIKVAGMVKPGTKVVFTE